MNIINFHFVFVNNAAPRYLLAPSMKQLLIEEGRKDSKDIRKLLNLVKSNLAGSHVVYLRCVSDC